MQSIIKRINYYEPVNRTIDLFVWIVQWIFIDLFNVIIHFLNINKNKESETIKYEDKYLKEYNDLEEKEYSKKALETLHDCVVEEKTEKHGLIKIMYNIEKNQFFYYTDKIKSVPYSILDVVARKYVIENDCKCIFININDEIKQLEEKRLEDKNKKTETTNNNDSVFVNFKNYNIKKKNVYIKTRVNNYKYGGSFSELNQSSSIEKGKSITFSEYKKNV